MFIFIAVWHFSFVSFYVLSNFVLCILYSQLYLFFFQLTDLINISVYILADDRQRSSFQIQGYTAANWRWKYEKVKLCFEQITNKKTFIVNTDYIFQLVRNHNKASRLKNVVEISSQRHAVSFFRGVFVRWDKYSSNKYYQEI